MAEADSPSKDKEIEEFERMPVDQLKEELLSALRQVEEKIPDIKETISSISPNQVNKKQFVDLLFRASTILSALEMLDQKSTE